ncbi:MAG: putative alpha/beta-fold hydrolase [Planctomycetota bacterium]|jgi:predicted alpha/beta-fold hydrolase
MDKIRLSGHIWTVVPRLIGNMSVGMPQGTPWNLTYQADDGSDVLIAGRFLGSEKAKSLVILLHGLGGSSASPYCRNAMSHLETDDIAILSLAMRGSDRSGQDFYHCGLTDDLHALVKDPWAEQFDKIYILGFSVGGHVALKFATEEGAEAVSGVAGICCPLDLKACSDWMDGVGRNFYRRHVLKGLKEIYTLVAESGKPVPTPVEKVQAIDSFREWDEFTVVPRYGFDSVEHYYESQSVSGHLSKLRIPSLLIVAENDPMVPAWTIRPALEDAAPCLDVHWVERGGHLGFPRKLNLGFGSDKDLGLTRQIFAWFRSQS